jgi:hypothetical protein
MEDRGFRNPVNKVGDTVSEVTALIEGLEATFSPFLPQACGSEGAAGDNKIMYPYFFFYYI